MRTVKMLFLLVFLCSVLLLASCSNKSGNANQDQDESGNPNDSTEETADTPVLENDAFQVFLPEPNTEVGPTFTIKGKARVFEAAFSWELEDGHTILAQGNELADAGAPEWGDFEFDVSFEKASQPNIMLLLFVHSAKDGAVENQLVIPLKAREDLINYSVE